MGGARRNGPRLDFAGAQQNYVTDWFRRVDKTQAEPPHWVPPMATTSPRLEEEFRYHQLWTENAERVRPNSDRFPGMECAQRKLLERRAGRRHYPDHR